MRYEASACQSEGGVVSPRTHPEVVPQGGDGGWHSQAEYEGEQRVQLGLHRDEAAGTQIAHIGVANSVDAPQSAAKVCVPKALLPVKRVLQPSRPDPSV
jgi:hypothetical protein